MQKIKTNELLSILNKVDRKADIDQFASDYLLDSKLYSTTGYLQKMLEKYNISRSQAIEKSNISRTYAYQIFSGERKPGRDKIIAICLAIGLTLEETQRTLCISGLGALYPRIKRDTVFIFAVNKKLSVIDTNELLFEIGEKILE